MTIYARWIDWRKAVALGASGYHGLTVDKNMTFLAGTHSVQRTDGGNFVTDGHVAGYTSYTSSTVDNNFELTIQSVSADTIVFVEAVTVAEVSFTTTIYSTHLDADGVPTWPVTKLRMAGFDGGLSGLPALPSLSTPIVIQAGGDDADFYVSQRSDDVTKQFWTVTPFAVTKGVVLTASALAATEFPGMTTVTPEAMAALFRDVHVYARKQGAVGELQWLDVYRELVS